MGAQVDSVTAPNGDVQDANVKLVNGSSKSDEAGSQTKSTVKRRAKYKHVAAVHSKAETSCLTKGGDGSPSFVGFKNLMILVLLVSNLRLILVNFRKYGVLICIRCHDYRRQDVVLGTILYLSVPIQLFIAYSIELAAARQAQLAVGRAKKDESQIGSKALASETRSLRSTWQFIAFAHGINATLNLAIATAVVYYFIYHPGIGTLCEIHAVVVWLKTISYALTNRDLRHAFLHPSPGADLPSLYSSCSYPRNITLSNLTYFWWAPTLLYQPVYPRTSSVRWGFVSKRVAEIVILSIAIWIASAQYAAPLLQNSLIGMSHLDFSSILERLMKLSSISLFCWLAGFFAIFQSFLNLLAEIMRFADRDFYGDWWNSSSVRGYWTSWNKPVSSFMKRHVYVPLVGRGVPAPLAQILVFVFSGVLHELLVGIPTHNVLGVAFAGMVFQIPLIVLTDVITRIKGMGGPTTGNVIFWVSFVLVGQPLAALLYFFAWHAKYGSASRPDFQALWK